MIKEGEEIPLQKLFYLFLYFYRQKLVDGKTFLVKNLQNSRDPQTMTFSLLMCV